jgi:antitoxin component of RelBE/YafQ-DinJ toxin-antitoxin module
MSDSTTRVQIEVPTELKSSFKERAKVYGMDLSNAMRFVMQQFSIGAIVPTIQTNEDIYVSKNKATEYEEIAKSIRSGNTDLVGPFSSSSELMASLDN